MTGFILKKMTNKKIIEILKKIRPESDFLASNDFIGDGILDSFDIVTLVSDLDVAFEISIPGVDIIPENFKNTESIAALVHKYQAPQ